MSEKRTNEQTVFELIGGQTTFDRLVDAFYDRVEGDLVLRPLYPDSLSDSRRHLALFLGQYFGGPPAYSRLRGHPRLRMRHLPFAIGKMERDHWVEHMLAALDDVGIAEPSRSEMTVYFADGATFMINQD